MFQIVESPIGKGLGVLLNMSVASFIAGAGPRTLRRVNADLQPLRMDIIGERLHVGKLRIGLQHAVGVALALPAIVDVDIKIADRKSVVSGTSGTVGVEPGGR